MALSADDRVADIIPARSRLPHARRFLNGAPASRVVGLTVLALILAFLSVYPLSMLLYGSFHSTPPGVAGAFDLSGYAKVFTWPTVLWRRPLRMGKYFLSPLTSRSTDLSAPA